MKFLPMSAIYLVDRIRSEPEQDLTELKKSIKEIGLLQPLVVSWDNEANFWRLVAGGRRLRALGQLFADEEIIFFDRHLIDSDKIPVIELTDPSPDRNLQAEIEENTKRVPLTWQEEAKATADLIRIRREYDPSLSYNKLAKEFIEDTSDPRAPVTIRQKFQMSEAVSEALQSGDPDIVSAKSLHNAYQILREKERIGWQNELIRRAPPSQDIKLEQLPFYHMQGLHSNLFDLVLFDWLPHLTPNKSGQFLIDAFRILNPQGNLLIFCQYRDIAFLYAQASNAGFTPYPIPFHWQQARSGTNLWHGTRGIWQTLHPIFYATKGNLGLPYPSRDLLEFHSPNQEKPLELFCHLIESTTNPGDTIFDPMCGIGTSLRAAKLLKRKALGYTLSDENYRQAQSNIFYENGD